MSMWSTSIGTRKVRASCTAAGSAIASDSEKSVGTTINFQSSKVSVLTGSLWVLVERVEVLGFRSHAGRGTDVSLV